MRRATGACGIRGIPLWQRTTSRVCDPGSNTPIFINEIHYDNVGIDDDEGIEVAGPAGTDLAGYEAQLASTKMFYTPAEALELTNSEQLKTTMKQVAEFSFEHGLLGEGAPDAGFIGVLTPSGIYGSETNVKLRFDPSYMQMAADGKL